MKRWGILKNSTTVETDDIKLSEIKDNEHLRPFDEHQATPDKQQFNAFVKLGIFNQKKQCLPLAEAYRAQIVKAIDREVLLNSRAEGALCGMNHAPDEDSHDYTIQLLELEQIRNNVLDCMNPK